MNVLEVSQGKKVKDDYCNGFNLDLTSQIELFRKIICKNEILNEVLIKTKKLNLTNYYIGAGCLAQTIWNYLSGFSSNHGIKDIDFVYFDKDLSYEKEDSVISEVRGLLKDIPIKIDIKNQARVHLWYKKHFGYDIKPYSQVEEAINTWPTTATAIAIRLNQDNHWVMYAPFGLNDVFGKIVRANKTQITKKIYEKKVQRWLSIWPDLKVIPWEK